MMTWDRVREKGYFPVICTIGAIAILSSTMSKNPVLNPFAESLGTPEALMGFVAAASTLPGVLISLPAGSLSDVFGRRRVLIASSVVFASAPFFYILITSWWQLILVRFFHGFATAIFIPVARASIAEHYPHKRGERISTFTSATIVGRGIAPLLGGLILSVTVWSFRFVYLAVGIAGITMLLTTTVLFGGNERLEKERPIDTQSNGSKRKLEDEPGWKGVLSNANIMAVSSTEAAARYVFGALEFFLVGYLVGVTNLDPSLIGTIMSMQLVMIPVVSPLMGRLSDRIGRKIPIMAGLVMSGLPLILVPYATQFLPILLISMVYGLGFSMVISSTPALVGDLARKENYGAAMGLLATLMDVGQMLGPIFTGFILAAFGYFGSFLSLGMLLLACAILFAAFTRISPLPRGGN